MCIYIICALWFLFYCRQAIFNNAHQRLKLKNISIPFLHVLMQ